MPEEDEYILGTDGEEVRRLRFQHHAWVQQMLAILARAGLATGHVALDLGSGPGFTTLELARTVGPGGRVIARDASDRFLAYLRKTCDARGLAQVATSHGPVETLSLPSGSVDVAYARWLFCWLPDPASVIATIARLLRPGGALIVQDYLDWAAKRLVPRSAVHDRVVAACMQSWELGGGNIDVGDLLPGYARACGLTVEVFEPLARLGRVGSLEWRWLGEFYESYVPRLVERGLLTQPAADAFFAEWAERSREGSSYIYTPTMVDVVLRKP